MATNFLFIALTVFINGQVQDWGSHEGLSDFTSPQDQSLNTQDDAQVANPTLHEYALMQVEECPDLQWMFYHSSFELASLDPKQVYIYNDSPCMFYIKDLDTASTNSYGTCEIDYTGILNFFFANGQETFTFNWVSGYNDIPAFVDHSNAIGRFKHNSYNGGNSYLWY